MDYCVQCSIKRFNRDFGDFAARKGVKVNPQRWVNCTDCGFAWVDPTGYRIEPQPPLPSQQLKLKIGF